MKKSLMVILCFFLLTFAYGETTADVTILIDQEPFRIEDTEQNILLPAYIHNNRTVIPVRGVINAFGIKNEQITWNGTNRTVTIIANNGDQIVLQIDNRSIQYNDKVLNTDVAPLIIDNRTYLPLSALSSLFDVDIEWNGDTRTVSMWASRHVLQEEKLMFNFPVEEGYVFKSFEKDRGLLLGELPKEDFQYVLEKYDLNQNQVISSLFITIENRPIDQVFDEYLTAHYLSADDFSILSNHFVSFYREGHDSIAFVEVNGKTLQLNMYHFNIEKLSFLVDSIKEVE